MIEKMIPLFSKQGLINPLLKIVKAGSNLLDLNHYKSMNLTEHNRELYKSREKRMLDTIFMLHEPDRVPVIGNGINFFTAKYAGISCKDFMFDKSKLKNAVIKLINDFDLDMFFMHYFFATGQLITLADVNLLKIPGRDLDVNSGYQYHEVDRLKIEEFEPLLKEKMPFFLKNIAPRMAGLLKKTGIARNTAETRLILETIKYGLFITEMQNEMRAIGGYNIFGTVGFPPFDLLSFAFRTVESLAKDMMKKDLRQKIIELCALMNPGLINLWSLLPKFTGQPGVWFTIERAFSLSPRQFEQFYWPTMKLMIIAMVKQGLIPFLTMESDVTHLVHFLLELPRNVSRRCVFNCDTSDIFQAHKILDGHMCIAGNIPLATMCVGSPHDVDKYCEKLFAELKPGGGYILSPALGIPDEAKPENVHAMINYAKKYGKYK